MSLDESKIAEIAEAEVMAPKAPKGTKVGVVTSAKMKKTIVVTTRKRKYDSKYDLHFFKHVKCYAHDEEEIAKEGDKVRIVPAEKRGKTKRYALDEVLKVGGK